MTGEERKVPPHVRAAAQRFADVIVNATPEDWARAEKEVSKHMLDEPDSPPPAEKGAD